MVIRDDDRNEDNHNREHNDDDDEHDDDDDDVGLLSRILRTEKTDHPDDHQALLAKIHHRLAAPSSSLCLRSSSHYF